MTLERPFSQACENNKKPILRILKSAFAPTTKVLEIGSGTGQHAEYFAENLPHLLWQPTDQAQALPSLVDWLAGYSGANMLKPKAYGVGKDTAGILDCDGVFSANTAHIMSWEHAQQMLTIVGQSLPSDGVFALYGPFNYNGRFTSESNASFDQWLKETAPHQGIRDFEKVNEIACKNGLSLICDHDMPANNRLLVWKKLDSP